VTLVLDASLTLCWYFEDEPTPAADAVLDQVTNTGAVVPSLWRLETANDLQEYIEAAGVAGNREGPRFRATVRRTGVPTDRPMTQSDAWRLLQRRARDSGIPAAVCNHTFRATGITAYLDNGGSLENAQAMAAQESARTTKLYDRTDD